MTSAEKKKFIKDLCNNVRDTLVAQVKDMPECWDGAELRLLLANRFNENWNTMDKKRLREFRNEVLTRNL